MDITEVRIFKKSDADKKLRAFASITFDHSFVVRDVKVIEGNKGLFVAMPSRRLREPCRKCGHRSEMRSRFCSQCGTQIEQTAPPERKDGVKTSEHRDIAHPITAAFREQVQRAVLDAYARENTAGSEKPAD